MNDEIKYDNFKILKWLIVIIIFILLIIVILFYSWFFYEAGQVNNYENLANNSINNIQYVEDNIENKSLKSELELYENSTKIISQSYGIDYYIENDIFYTDKDNIKIISANDAAEIAEKEANNEKYQYQSWKSEFYARGKDNNEVLSATLLDGTKTIDIKEEWKYADYYNETLIWEIRLFDNNDPLTSLFVYVNAIDGTIIGAQELSD